MPNTLHIVVCAGISPDPLQTLEPTTDSHWPGLEKRNGAARSSRSMGASALYEAANRSRRFPATQQSRQQTLASLARPQSQAAASHDDRRPKSPLRARRHRRPHRRIPRRALNGRRPRRSHRRDPRPRPHKLLLFGGWESATRGAGVTLQIIGERLGITDQFYGVDQIDLRDDGFFEVLERIEGGKHQVSVCVGTPAVLGWATGNLAEPRNNPQVGMANMRTIMPALQKAKSATLAPNGFITSASAFPSSSAPRA